MKIFYSSFPRFQKRIIHKWQKSGFEYNSSHLQLLRFAWIASIYWANRNGDNVSEVNKIDTKHIRLW